MPSRLATWAIIAVSLIGAFLLASPAVAQTADVSSACGRQLSAPVLAKWTAMGGAGGVLGCPQTPEMPGSTSPVGTKAREADFAAGMILWHADGPRAGQTFAVTGCIFRLYFQYGGPSGWLGLPTDDPTNFPDGQRQTFEGGRVTYLRAPNDCSAERTVEVAAARPPPPDKPNAPTSPLDAFFDAARGDHLSAASAGVVKTALAANYQRIGNQSAVFDDAVPGAAPLKLFWNESIGDHLATATVEGERDAFANGYQFEASQGFVWTDPRPGARALQQFSDPVTGHHWLVATPDEEAEARSKGYVFQRIEGYAPPS
jgi:hypothetical protein